MSKRAHKKKSRNGETRVDLAPVASVKVKMRPRGKSFQPGNGWGAQFRYKPGQSGNPSGRTSAQQKASAEISRALMERLPQRGSKALLKGAGRSFTQKLADRWIEEGLAGNIGAISSLSDRVEGKPPTAINVSGGTDNLDLILMEMTARYDEIGPPEGHPDRLAWQADHPALGAGDDDQS